jgi:acyl-CoA thioesterase
MLGMELVALDEGSATVEMSYEPSRQNNIYGRAHGGALFALIDEAFETAAQTGGTVAVALNVNVSYVASPEPGMRLQATARRIAETKQTATYEIRVTGGGRLLALCQALAFKTGKPIPFLKTS